MLRRAEAVGVVDTEDCVFVGVFADPAILVLEGTAALIWDAALGADRADVAARVAEAVGQDVETVAPDVDAFLTRMIDQGALIDSPE